ncbi:MAG: hypothetical protein HRT37_16000 [Alteromonadaceae bacterium]|nr:hypothetical protein [Alteromonadaceae bacterium]
MKGNGYNLKNFFLEDTGKTVIQTSYGHNVYQLYKEMDEDNGLDLIGVVQEAIKRRGDCDDDFFKIDEDKILDIYLFFDYDPHTTNACNNKLNEMLELFNNSQENGMLFVSYPMVEAIRHIKHLEPVSVFHPLSNLQNYKSFINQKGDDKELINISTVYHNWGLYNINIWSSIIHINLKRANELVNDSVNLPDDILSQDDIFENQKRKHIEPNNLISVISAFPLMLHEYYGMELFDKLES